MQNLLTLVVHGKKVLTTRQLAGMYGTEPEIINNNFIRNKTKYVLEKHYMSVSGEEMRQLKTSHQFDGELRRVSRAYFWTEKGALLHAKSLNTDKAWEVYDYLVDFYFRAEGEPEKKEVVPVMVKTEPLRDELPLMSAASKESQDAINIFKILMSVSERQGLEIITKNLSSYRSHLCGHRIAVRSGLSLEAVNYEIAFELFHAVVNCDKGDMLNTPLAKYYNSQAERAAELIITLLNTNIA